MPRITRRHKKTSRKHVKKTKYTRRKRIGKKHRTRRRRGGMPPSKGWMGPPVEPTESHATMANLLFKNDAYKPNSSDHKTVDLYNLEEAKDDLNAYFRHKIQKINNTPVPITIMDMKLSDCTKLLRAGKPGQICLNVEYKRRLGRGGLKFNNFRQIGPLEIFKNDATGSFELPFITILNLLDLRFDATRPITEADARNPDHILSLLINDIFEEQYDMFTIINLTSPDAPAAAVEPAPPPAAAEPATPAPATPAPARLVPRGQARVAEAFANLFTPPN